MFHSSVFCISVAIATIYIQLFVISDSEKFHNLTGGEQESQASLLTALLFNFFSI